MKDDEEYDSMDQTLVYTRHPISRDKPTQYFFDRLNHALGKPAREWNLSAHLEDTTLNKFLETDVETPFGGELVETTDLDTDEQILLVTNPVWTHAKWAGQLPACLYIYPDANNQEQEERSALWLGEIGREFWYLHTVCILYLLSKRKSFIWDFTFHLLEAQARRDFSKPGVHLQVWTAQAKEPLKGVRGVLESVKKLGAESPLQGMLIWFGMAYGQTMCLYKKVYKEKGKDKSKWVLYHRGGSRIDLSQPLENLLRWIQKKLNRSQKANANHIAQRGLLWWCSTGFAPFTKIALRDSPIAPQVWQCNLGGVECVAKFSASAETNYRMEYELQNHRMAYKILGEGIPINHKGRTITTLGVPKVLRSGSKKFDSETLYGMCMEKLDADLCGDTLSFEILETICVTVQHLASQGYTHGDLHAGNVMRKGQELYMVDFESLGQWRDAKERAKADMAYFLLEWNEYERFESDEFTGWTYFDDLMDTIITKANSLFESDASINDYWRAPFYHKKGWNADPGEILDKIHEWRKLTNLTREQLVILKTFMPFKQFQLQGILGEGSSMRVYKCMWFGEVCTVRFPKFEWGNEMMLPALENHLKALEVLPSRGQKWLRPPKIIGIGTKQVLSGEKQFNARGICMEKLEGTLLQRSLTLDILERLAFTLLGLEAEKCSHGDFKSDNIMYKGDVWFLVDFDNFEQNLTEKEAEESASADMAYFLLCHHQNQDKSSREFQGWQEWDTLLKHLLTEAKRRFTANPDSFPRECKYDWHLPYFSRTGWGSSDGLPAQIIHMCRRRREFLNKAKEFLNKAKKKIPKRPQGVRRRGSRYPKRGTRSSGKNYRITLRF